MPRQLLKKLNLFSIVNNGVVNLVHTCIGSTPTSHRCIGLDLCTCGPDLWTPTQLVLGSCGGYAIRSVCLLFVLFMCRITANQLISVNYDWAYRELKN